MKTHSFRIQYLVLSALFIFLFIQGCAPKTTVVLLPDPSGKVGHVTVQNDSGAVDLNKARQATVIKGKQAVPAVPELLSEKKIQEDFAEALSALPEQPIHFVLYFQEDSNLLTEESKYLLDDILQAIKDRQSHDISVFGHTDTVGNQEYNLRLSKNRALAIGQILIELGVNPKHLNSTSHGENNPLKVTPDNTPEPLNRRVEVVIK